MGPFWQSLVPEARSTYHTKKFSNQKVRSDVDEKDAACMPHPTGSSHHDGWSERASIPVGYKVQPSDKHRIHIISMLFSRTLC